MTARVGSLVLAILVLLGGFCRVEAQPSPARVAAEEQLWQERLANQQATGRLLTNFERQLDEGMARANRRAAQVRLLVFILAVIVVAGLVATAVLLYRLKRRGIAWKAAYDRGSDPAIGLLLEQQSELRQQQNRIAKSLSRFEIAASAWREDLARFEKDRRNLERLMTACRTLAIESGRRIDSIDEDVDRLAKRGAE